MSIIRKYDRDSIAMLVFTAKKGEKTTNKVIPIILERNAEGKIISYTDISTGIKFELDNAAPNVVNISFKDLAKAYMNKDLVFDEQALAKKSQEFKNSKITFKGYSLDGFFAYAKTLGGVYDPPFKKADGSSITNRFREISLTNKEGINKLEDLQKEAYATEERLQETISASDLKKFAEKTEKILNSAKSTYDYYKQQEQNSPTQTM